jgi:hypothetical protein
MSVDEMGYALFSRGMTDEIFLLEIGGIRSHLWKNLPADGILNPPCPLGKGG